MELSSKGTQDIRDLLNPELWSALRGAKSMEYLIELLSGFQMKNPRSAGIDVGAMEHYVGVPSFLSEQKVRCFGAFTLDLENLADWLVSLKIESVVMESTGNYWQSLFEVLESRGIEVCLANARHAKNVSGRKSDIEDCQWLQQLHTYGLLAPSFIPESEIRTLRTYIRQRGYLEKLKSQSLQSIHKALTSMNIKIQHIISDLEGVVAQKIIRAIAAGQTNAKVLASYRSDQMKASLAEFEQALTGHYRTEHVFVLQQALSSLDFYLQGMRECEVQIEKQLLNLQCSLPTPEKGTESIEFSSRTKKSKVRKNQYGFDVKHYLKELLGTDLTDVEGLQENTLLEIIAETGTDLSKWKTAKHFTSWLKLSPNPQISGGKVIRHKKIKTDNRANQAFRLAARSLHASQSYLGRYYRSLSHRKGVKIAIKAVARKLATIFYTMVKNKVPYQQSDFAVLEQKFKEKTIKNMEKKAKKLGFQMVPINT